MPSFSREPKERLATARQHCSSTSTDVCLSSSRERGFAADWKYTCPSSVRHKFATVLTTDDSISSFTSASTDASRRSSSTRGLLSSMIAWWRGLSDMSARARRECTKAASEAGAFIVTRRGWMDSAVFGGRGRPSSSTSCPVLLISPTGPPPCDCTRPCRAGELGISIATACSTSPLLISNTDSTVSASSSGNISFRREAFDASLFRVSSSIPCESPSTTDALLREVDETVASSASCSCSRSLAAP
mmetsp:Transcript_405/g.695  ORF Transcript_405/g.695 Transcript_405/m.695 type:complete len:246 (+) Transcript_405:756-1493(+)